MAKSVGEVATEILRSADRPISTYELAKRAKVSWSTMNMHCFRLSAKGVIKGREEKAPVGLGKKMLWSLK